MYENENKFIDATDHLLETTVIIKLTGYGQWTYTVTTIIITMARKSVHRNTYQCVYYDASIILRLKKLKVHNYSSCECSECTCEYK